MSVSRNHFWFLLVGWSDFYVPIMEPNDMTKRRDYAAPNDKMRRRKSLSANLPATVPEDSELSAIHHEAPSGARGKDPPVRAFPLSA